MRVREKVGIFDNQSGNSQGILIHVLGLNPVNRIAFYSRIRACCSTFGELLVENPNIPVGYTAGDSIGAAL